MYRLAAASLRDDAGLRLSSVLEVRPMGQDRGPGVKFKHLTFAGLAMRRSPMPNGSHSAPFAVFNEKGSEVNAKT